MKWSELLKDAIGKNENFVIGKDSFSDLQINSTPINNFYYFYHSKDRRLIKQFVLKEKDKRNIICQVTLINKGEKFTPRLALSVRDKALNKILEKETTEVEVHKIRGSVNLNDCHEEFWKLISFLRSIRNIEIPEESFSLMSQSESEIVNALKGRDASSVRNIIKQLSSAEGIVLTQSDINNLLKRREKLKEFENGLINHASDEAWWQNFFEENKWIFGYGLNYQILRQEQSQPHYGGVKVDGKGGERGDYLTATDGDMSFTVLVEIKTPDTSLLQGSQEIRNGAWSLAKDLTDALSQIEANIHTWDKQGSEQPDNRDRFEAQNVFTIQPKGIIVIGKLETLLDSRSKRETFQRFRKSIHGVDIVTFDELYNRAKFIVENVEEN
ncbi:MAG: DUF4263 domain-containing protein [Candidatus Nomurabacteria bacterium]|nr:MAG: DUF4263 domain-containing protein [Candidatus Nomurabacteria bacterium]